MKSLTTADAVRYRRMNAAELRESFLLENLFAPGTIELVYTDADRAIVGSAVPTDGPLELSAAAELRAEFFCERRELGVLNIGRSGEVTVDGKTYPMDTLDGLYIGRGSREVRFANSANGAGAEFYLLSYPAHAAHPTSHARKADAEAVQLGTVADCNRRTIYKYIHPRGIPSCQLVMGFTELAEGSVWNTMPCHTHARRSEIYLYFGMRPETRVFHFMGAPDDTRHLLIGSRQAVVSPSWSIHSGAGTGAYTFCWGMGGENQTFEDMDPVALADLR